jgi:hypothetical protein
LIQHEPQHFELKLVMTENNKQLMQDLIAGLKELLGQTAVIDTAIFSELERTEGGKFRPVVSLRPKKE